MDQKQQHSIELSNEKKRKADNLKNYLCFRLPRGVSVAEIFRQLSENNIYPGQLVVETVSSFLPKAKIERVSDANILLTFPNGESLFFTIQDNGSIVVLTKSDMGRRKIKNKYHLNDLLKHFEQQHEFCARCAPFYDQSESKTVLTHDFECASMHSKKQYDLCEICAELSGVSFHDQHDKHQCFYCQKMFFINELIDRSNPVRSGTLFLPQQLCVVLGYVTSFEIPHYICLKCSCEPRNM
jgi:hypothetical protein